MLRQKKFPSYGLHKASGQARVVIGGRTIYLGKYDSPENHAAYARVLTRLASETAPVRISNWRLPIPR